MDKRKENNSKEIIDLDKISNIHFYWVNLSWINFSWKTFNDCIFEKCNLSNIELKDTTFNSIEFNNSKIMWLKFVDINHFLSNFEFNDCNISLSSFYWLNLKNTNFNDCEIKETDFNNSNLENVNFNYCDLEKSIFANCNLKKTNFVWSYNFSIDPTINKLNKTKFSRENCVWLLSNLDIIIE